MDSRPLKAVNQLRQNVKALLLARKEDQKSLAFSMGVHPTTLNKFLQGTREVQLAHLDKIAEFFGLATYQLFQPGIAPLTERRHVKDRRSGQDRRLGHQLRYVQTLDAALGVSGRSTTRPPAETPYAAPAILDQLRRLTEEHARNVTALFSTAEPGGQTAAAGRASPAPPRRRRAVRGSAAKEPV